VDDRAEVPAGRLPPTAVADPALPPLQALRRDTVLRNPLIRLCGIVLVLTPRLVAADEPVPLSLAEATARALARNPEIAIDREDVALAEQAGRRAEGAYDVQLEVDGRFRSRTDPLNNIFSGAPDGALAPRINSLGSTAGFSRLFASGATASASTGLSYDTTNGLFNLLSPAWYSSLAVDLRQPLAQGLRIDPARRALRIAAVDRERSVHALRRTVAETVAAVERAYWTLVASRRDVAVRRSAVALAEQQRDDTQAQIEAGTAPESDLAQPVAEIERRKGDLYAAEETAARAEHGLKTLMLGAPDDAWWDARLEPTEVPAVVPLSPEVRSAIDRALAERPEIAAASQLLTRQDIEIEAARDRTRPAVDLVASYALRGLAGTQNEDLTPPFPTPIVVPADLDGALGQSYLNLLEHRFLDASVGVAVSVPLGNRTAQADLASAEITKRQVSLGLDQLRQRIGAEVRNAVVGLLTTRQRVDAAHAGRAAAEVQLQAARDRFEAGTTILYFVLTRQNDLAEAVVTETAALADYQKAMTEYARAVGSLLADRHIQVEPVAGDRR
jgi:outer membrane protein TolC